MQLNLPLIRGLMSIIKYITMSQLENAGPYIILIDIHLKPHGLSIFHIPYREGLRTWV